MLRPRYRRAYPLRAGDYQSERLWIRGAGPTILKARQLRLQAGLAIARLNLFPAPRD